MFFRCFIMIPFISIFWITPLSSLAQPEQTVQIKPIFLGEAFEDTSFTCAVYSIDAEFTEGDTVLFSQKEEYLKITKVERINQNELNFNLRVLPGFQTLGPRDVFVVDQAGAKKIKAQLDIRYGPKPIIQTTRIISRRKVVQDTLQLESFGTTSAELALKGNGFFPGTKIQFDDPAIKALNEVQYSSIFTPDSLVVRLLINEKSRPEIGKQRFTLSNPFTKQIEGRIIVRSAMPPRITSPIGNFVAEGTEYLIRIRGLRFSKYCQVSTLPAEANCRSEFVHSREIKFYLTLPILQENKGYRLVVINPDGQADTASTFFAMAKPLAHARAISASNKELFAGQEARIEVALRLKKFESLSSKIGYEISFGSSRFPIEQIKNDSTIIAQVQLPPSNVDLPESFYNFTANPVGQSPRWKGSVRAKSPPKITYMTPNRILHPLDTLQVMIKGSYLNQTSIVLEDPELAAQVLEASDDRVRFNIIAGKNISLSSHPLMLKKGNVTFQFDKYRFEVREWEQFNKFVAIECRALGTLTANRLWSGEDRIFKIKSGDHITLKFYGREIAEELGIQKISVTGVVLDSTGAIRAEAVDKKVIAIGHSNEIIPWHFRVRQGIHSGERIEIIISNPGNQNRVAELFCVERHWFEAFRGAATFALLKIPTGAENKKTELLKNIGFGINWQPWADRPFIGFDGTFLVGNPSTTDTTINVEVGLGFSVVLWNYLQIGVGTNLTGDAFSESFVFLGTRFRLPLPK